MTAEQSLKHPWLQRAKREAEARPLDPEILDNLRDFAKLSYFKRAALEAIAFTMSAPSIKHLREQFVKLDNDNSGFVSLSDFCITLQECGMSQVRALPVILPQPRINAARARVCRVL
ncbi:MAG: hypothetical protein EON48_07315 [Acetobacteraceae bacterium]|nr:MAG: hypothetical protein EON48_07315 [Acetobacteraceae bacterium]